MLNLKKQADTLKVGDIELGTCPACISYVSHLYFMQDAVSKVQSRWYSCKCGVVWQAGIPKGVHDNKYLDGIRNNNKLRDCYQHTIRLYAPIIEELVYGRRVLIVGGATPHEAEFFAHRGWIPEVIDKDPKVDDFKWLIRADFEKHDLGQDGKKYNLIWMYQSLECFLDPVSALAKCSSLLTEDGILFIGSPDTDFIHTRGSSGFIHWKPDMNFVMWNIPSITKQLEKLGFVVIMSRQNYEQRFPAWDDFHLMAQKKYF